ncbi:major facilitator superfamily transporter [Colletotrichum gloeosporioides Cg-14]|uniref:Major facilitator superfamily transporter n=1 Tax=Colletotrichum gloeosporioides (strain Cg-14) TaxID=1237896 RepID=T0KIV6_COLGC|nr:major facilitator superfamily transporter [Colletotrichum gloeosporioides Cg-14]
MQSFLQSRHFRLAAEAHLRSVRGNIPYETEAAVPVGQLSQSLEPSRSREDAIDAPERSENLCSTSDRGSHKSTTEKNGESLIQITGVQVRDGIEYQRPPGPVFVVSWERPEDPSNPRNWSLARRVAVTIQVGLISTAVGAASGIDATALPQAAADFGVSEVTESLATGLYLVGIGLGSLIAGPFSETFGRNAVYLGSMFIFSTWIMAAALSPNITAQLIFRFLAGCCGSTPIVCCGGSIADLWNSAEKTWTFPLYTTFGFGGSVLGAIMGAYIAPSGTLNWRWVEWIILILSGALILIVLFFMPETYAPVLLHWKASQWRRVTGDRRFTSEHELMGTSFMHRLKLSMSRPFLMLTEPIIIAMTLYITVLYIILFTFFVGWPYIFEKTYAIPQGLSNIIFVAMFLGMQLTYVLVPFIYKKTTRAVTHSNSPEAAKHLRFSPELRLWFAMLGTAPAIPISLFWMGWTAAPSISIWSPILAAALFGFGVTGVFISTYLYIIDSYEVFSASALTFASLVRYVAAGGMTVVGIPFYENMGTNYTLTIMACISLALVPIPYLLHRYGHRLRERSKYAVSWD